MSVLVNILDDVSRFIVYFVSQQLEGMIQIRRQRSMRADTLKYGSHREVLNTCLSFETVFKVGARVLDNTAGLPFDRLCS